MQRISYGEVSLDDALHLKAAQLWAEVGKPLRALDGLAQLSDQAWHCAWTDDVIRLIATAFREDQSLVEQAAISLLRSDSGDNHEKDLSLVGEIALAS